MQTEKLPERVELNKKKSIKWRKVSWIVITVCMTLFIIMPQMYIPITWLMLPFIGIMFFYDDFYTLWGLFLFFEENLVIIPGLSLFALYSMMVLFKFVVLDKGEKKIPVLILPAMVILLLYAMFAMPSADTSAAKQGYIASGRAVPSDAVINMRLIAGYMLDCAVMIVLALRVSGSDRLKRTLFMVIAASAMFSGLYGYRVGNIFLYGGDMSTVVRYMASFNDPNYAGFFFNMAIFIVLCLDEFKKLYIKIPLLIVFYYFLFATGSMSGLIFNAIGLVIFTIFRYQYKAILGLMILTVVVAVVGIVIIRVPKIRNLSVVVNIEERITRQFINTEENNADMTSGRAGQWKKYWKYFNEQELEGKLFGGNMIMSSSIDEKFKDKFGNAPHQAYLSFLLDFGIVGAAVMILFFICKTAYCFALMCRTNKDTALMMFIIGCMWFFYGFGFDYFGDWRFMIYYFL